MPFGIGRSLKKVGRAFERGTKAVATAGASEYVAHEERDLARDVRKAEREAERAALRKRPVSVDQAILRDEQQRRRARRRGAASSILGSSDGGTLGVATRTLLGG